MKHYYKRHLPHYQSSGNSFFITYRLANSLPVNVIVELKEQFEKLRRDGKPSYDEQKRYFGKFDVYLDKCEKSPKWLANDDVAKIVADAILSRDGKEYNLICYCIMPNHVHLVITVPEPVTRTSVREDVTRTLVREDVTRTSVREDVTRTLVRDETESTRTEVRATSETNAPYSEYIVTSFLRGLKGSTAREANKILNRTGAFWQHESYDHIVRDEKELFRIVEYVLNNPVKAGLVSERNEWKWSYVKKFE
ncbi:MAG: hypothetical protein FJ218_03515 [Ignavibacteria bacterium]|nr:hypothetical protein [Ignavibacteria bacterium]